MSVKRFRVASAAQVWDIFALEAFTFPALITLYLLFGGQYLLSLALTIMTAWPSALLCSVPVYIIYRLVWGVWTDRRLMSVIPAAVALFTLLAFVTYVVSSQPAPHGVSGLSSLLLSTLIRTRSVEVTPKVILAGVPLYLSLATYATIQGEGPSQVRNTALLLIAFGTTLTIGLAAFAVYVAMYPLLVFGVPGALLISIMWWMTRAREDSNHCIAGALGRAPSYHGGWSGPRDLLAVNRDGLQPRERHSNR